MSEQIVIGVDGGGTSTRVALATVNGEVLGIGQAGTGNFHDVSARGVQDNIERALGEAWQSAGQTPRQAAAAFLGMGSVASATDRQVIHQVACDLALAPAEQIGVDHDLSIALAGGLALQPGIVLIAGTGSSSYGRGPDGSTWRAGGWGHTLDDMGSSGWIGLQAMVATVREYDGRGVPTVLSARVMDALRLEDIQNILWRVDAQCMSRREMAALAPLVTEAAEQGDPVAQRILATGADELALLPATVATKLNLVEQLGVVPVTITGGLTKAGPAFVDTLHAAISRCLPEAQIVEPKCQPVIGAVLRAVELLEGAVAPSAVERLIQTHAI